MPGAEWLALAEPGTTARYRHSAFRVVDHDPRAHPARQPPHRHELLAVANAMSLRMNQTRALMSR
jgi:hypothetical protein